MAGDSATVGTQAGLEAGVDLAGGGVATIPVHGGGIHLGSQHRDDLLGGPAPVRRYLPELIDLVLTGAPANELTSFEARDPIAGTPWHKHVPARVERVEVIRGPQGAANGRHRPANIRASQLLNIIKC